MWAVMDPGLLVPKACRPEAEPLLAVFVNAQRPMPQHPNAQAEVLEEYEDEEIRKLVDVATAPPARPSSEAPRLLRGTAHAPS